MSPVSGLQKIWVRRIFSNLWYKHPNSSLWLECQFLENTSLLTTQSQNHKLEETPGGEVHAAPASRLGYIEVWRFLPM
jgi:hypothetical protein